VHVQNWPRAVIVALIWSLAPLFIFGFGGERAKKLVEHLPVRVRVLLPAVLGLPYLLVTGLTSRFQWAWLGVYLVLPVVVALALFCSEQRDPHQRGTWIDLAVLLGLGLAVDLRWLEAAWPEHASVICKMILLAAGIYGFTVIRPLSDVGFHLLPQIDDLKIGLRELLFYAPLVIPLGLALAFLHIHAYLPSAGSTTLAWISTFFFVAVPEEIYFRGWIQNLLERRIGRNGSLWLTAAIFGLSHFNKRAAHFNWRYVLLATLAGIFYGRAWRERRRVMASSITHTFVDTIWSIWLR
jgi:uncharacterized protein